MLENQETPKNNHLPSLDFFFRARVPPNFPRKDSSFFIFADCGVADVVAVPDIFQYVSVCVWFLWGGGGGSVDSVTPPCDAFRLQSQRTDAKRTHSQADSRLEDVELRRSRINRRMIHM